MKSNERVAEPQVREKQQNRPGFRTRCNARSLGLYYGTLKLEPGQTFGAYRILSLLATGVR